MDTKLYYYAAPATNYCKKQWAVSQHYFPFNEKWNMYAQPSSKIMLSCLGVEVTIL